MKKKKKKGGLNKRIRYPLLVSDVRLVHLSHRGYHTSRGSWLVYIIIKIKILNGF